MAKERGQLGLGIADRSKPGKDAFDYRAAQTEQWVRDLPMGNIGETARLVYEALHEVNHLAIAWKERYRFLELLREPIHYIQTSLSKRLATTTFPLPEKSQRVANLALSLANEMALGYKTAIEEMLGSSFLSRDNKALTVMIHRAIRYLSQAMLSSYQTYRPHPEKSWSELNALYLYAEHKNIYHGRVSDELNDLLPESSIARVYKQILLLALASPYRLRQGEAEVVYNALARYAIHAHILPYSDPAATEVLFSVHINSDRAPDYLVFNHEECNKELCRLVDTRELSQRIYEELERREGYMGSGQIPKELVVRLIRAWGIAPKRSFTRNERTDSNVTTVIGLTTLYRALAQAQGSADTEIHRARFNSRSVVGVSQPTTDDIWDIRGSMSISRDFERYKSLYEPDNMPRQESKIPTHTWQILNESAGGYRLALASNENAGVKVGELIGIDRSSSGKTWETGVVRWLRQGSDGHLEVGIQVLAPHAIPVLVSNERAAGKAADSQYGLLLEEIPAIKQPGSLIAPTLLFKQGDELSVNAPSLQTKLKLKERMQDSGAFAQFAYISADQQLTKAETQKPADRNKNRGNDGLGQVWDEL
jgi:cyclic-di-GMP-binding protein